MASGVQSPATVHTRTPMKGNLDFWFRVDSYCWIVFLLYWLVSALKRKEAKRKESWQERMRHVLPMAAAYTLMFAEYVHYGVLGARFVPAYRYVSAAFCLAMSPTIGIHASVGTLNFPAVDPFPISP